MNIENQVTNRAGRRAAARHRKARQSSVATLIVAASLSAGVAFAPSAAAAPQGGVGGGEQGGVTGGEQGGSTTAPAVPAPSAPVYWVEPPAEYQGIEYQPIPYYDYDTNTYTAPAEPTGPIRIEELHLPGPVEPAKPFIAPRDRGRLGYIQFDQPNWMSDIDLERTNNTSAVIESQVSTFWRSIGVETTRADRLAAAQLAGGFTGAVTGMVVAGVPAAATGAVFGGLIGGTIGGIQGAALGAFIPVPIPGAAAIPSGIAGTAAGAAIGAGIGAAVVGIPAAAAGAAIGGVVGVATGTNFGAGDLSEPTTVNLPDIDQPALTAQTEEVLQQWDTNPVGSAVVDAVVDVVEIAADVDQQARTFVAEQPGGEQLISQADAALTDLFNNATPGLASSLLSTAIGDGIPH